MSSSTWSWPTLDRVPVHPIRQGRLAVVYVSDDAKISDFICLHILEAEHLFQVKITANQNRKQVIL